MRLWPGAPVVAALVATVAAAAGEAHKPITSPYTFNEDVFPILQAHCSRCHVAGGVAPMALTTHAETVPWGESMRLELIAGHMPPWSAETSAGRLRRATGLTARELNTLLTWASGGTPVGDESKGPPPVVLEHGWRLGTPDAMLPLPEFTIGAETQEQTAELIVPVDSRPLRAIDFLPGNPAIVRSATISIRPTASPGTGGRAASARPTLLFWQPGDEPMALDDAAFSLPAGAELMVKVRYKKTWEYERQAMSDRSAIGLYHADPARPAVEALTIVLPGTVLDRDLRVLAVTPDPSLDGTDLRVDVTAPDGTRRTLIAFRPAAGWARRFWFDTAVILRRGTRIGMSASPAPALRPSVTLDVVPM